MAIKRFLSTCSVRASSIRTRFTFERLEPRKLLAADYVDDFKSPDPGPGWQYLWNESSAFGTSNGNGSVNVFDLLDFRRTYRQSSGDVGYDASHDGDGDGDVDVFDLLRFRRNYNTTFQWS